MNLSDLAVLLAVADHGSARSAGDALGLGRAAVRRALDRIEAEVGTSLLHRHSGGVDLTEAGQVVAERGRALLREGVSMVDEARAAAVEASGTLRLVVPVGLDVELGLQVIRLFRQLHPGLRVVVSEDEAPLESRHEPFDLLVHFGPPPPRGEWYTRSLATLAVGLFATPAYLAAHGRPEEVGDLDGHDLYVWRRPDEPPRSLPLVGGGSIAVEPALVSSSMQLVGGAAERDLGLAYVIERPAIVPGAELVRVVPEVGTTATVSVLSPRPAREDPKLDALQRNLDLVLARVL